ncbi:MAG: hypothetical protein ACPLQO_02215 [Desulfotomaculales bacterium]
MPEDFAGVESAPVAGEQQAQQEDQAGLDFSFLNKDQSGVEEPAAAGQEGEQGEDQRIEQAFAKRLAQEREKIRQELEQEFKQRYQQPMYQPPVQQVGPPQPSLEERAAKLAEEWMITPEAAKAFILQEERMKNLTTKLLLTEDNIAKTEAKAAIERQREKNPHLPPFNEQELLNIRLRHYNQYGVMPGWEDAYKMYVADAVTRGEITKNIEQQAISRITGRDKINVQVGRAEQPQKRDAWDLSKSEFEVMLEKAKRGELKKT